MAKPFDFGLATPLDDLTVDAFPSTRSPQEEAPEDAGPILTRDEIEDIRAKLVAGTYDDLDVQVLIDHADAVTNAYEHLVQRSAQEADRAQALVLRKEEEIGSHEDLHRAAAARMERLILEAIDRHTAFAHARAQLRRACQVIAIQHNNPDCACEFCEELRTEHHDGYDIVTAALAARS